MSKGLGIILLRSPGNRDGESACPSGMEAGEVEHKYKSAYEENMNPFSDWKQREKASRKKQLSLPERVLYEGGQVISSSQ